VVTVQPVPRALVPKDSAAATRVSARNYDEFQSDLEIWRELRERPECVLAVTMAHCSVERAEAMLAADSPASLARAAENLRALRASDLTRTVEGTLFVYEITDPGSPGVRQIGLGGMARTDEIRTDARPEGTIVRNEGIREEKARGRAALIRATGAYIGTVNHAVEDESGALEAALVAWADRRAPDFGARDERGCAHKVWLIHEAEAIERFRALLAAEPLAYVADGNHRSAAAVMAGLEGYLGVFFPAGTLGLAPYNRLVEGPRIALDELLARAQRFFEIEVLEGTEGYQPGAIHDVGLYAGGRWHRLRVREGTFDPGNAVGTIDADIVQRTLFEQCLGITDARDPRLTFVGGDRDARYLTGRVDSGEFAYAVTLAPVTTDQFVEVCRQGRLMPPKSTWFQPKLRMGLVIALLGQE
jgi:uncharacterized protein (DUF1015 family)